MKLLLEIQQDLNKLTWLLKVKAVTRVNFKELDIVDERAGLFRVFIVHGSHENSVRVVAPVGMDQYGGNMDIG